MEKTVDHCYISVDELDCKLVLVFCYKHGEERVIEKKEKDRKKERERQEQTERERERETKWEKERKAGKELKGRYCEIISKFFCIFL